MGATPCLIAAERDVAHAFAGIPVMSTEGLTSQQQKGGKLSRTLQQRMAFKSDGDMLTMVWTNPINNLPITSADVAAAGRMFGRDASYVRGNTTWKSPQSTKMDYLPVPRRIRELHNTVDLSADVFFVDKHPMLIVLTRNVRLVMGMPLPDRKKPPSAAR